MVIVYVFDSWAVAEKFSDLTNSLSRKQNSDYSYNPAAIIQYTISIV